MKITLCLCFLLVGLSLASKQQFEEFITTYGKTYQTTEEYNTRLQIFESNLEVAAYLSSQDTNAQYGVTKFMDLTREEFKTYYLIKNFTSTKIQNPNNVPMLTWDHGNKNASYPPEFDWRSHGVVTGVYNQGQCGSCWAFSTTEQIESMWARAGHGLHNLAMQQLVDCDHWSHGCGGGNPPDAYAYVIQAGGIDSLGSYPYVARNEGCRFNPRNVAAKVKQWGYITTTDNENNMLAWTSKYGPPSVCVDASNWQFYRGGIVTSNCATQLDHCVQVTGWITQSGISAWTVRNSWGTSWGESGYIYIMIGRDLCGIGQEVTACFTD